MKMKMTNAQMDNAITLLNELQESGKLGYAIAWNKRHLEDAAKEYLELKNEAIKKYGEEQKNDDGTTGYIIPFSESDKIEAFIADLGDIPGIEHDVEIFTISEETFYGGSLTSKQMEQLLWMVE